MFLAKIHICIYMLPELLSLSCTEQMKAKILSEEGLQ